ARIVRHSRMAPSEPSIGSLKTISAPYARITRFRSTLTFSGMTSLTAKPSAAPTIARPMPVLPDVESRMVFPGTSVPAARPASIIFFAGRSLTDPPGLNPSRFANSRTSSGMPSRTARISTIGVFPTRSSTERAATNAVAGSSRERSTCAAVLIPVASPSAGDGGHHRHLVAGLHRRVEVLKEPDVLAVHEDVDEPAHRAALVADAIPDAGMSLVQVGDECRDRGALGLHGLGAARVFSERRRNSHLRHDVESSFWLPVALVVLGCPCQPADASTELVWSRA